MGHSPDMEQFLSKVGKEIVHTPDGLPVSQAEIVDFELHHPGTAVEASIATAFIERRSVVVSFDLKTGMVIPTEKLIKGLEPQKRSRWNFLKRFLGMYSFPGRGERN